MPILSMLLMLAFSGAAPSSSQPRWWPQYGENWLVAGEPRCGQWLVVTCKHRTYLLQPVAASSMSPPSLYLILAGLLCAPASLAAPAPAPQGIALEKCSNIHLKAQIQCNIEQGFQRQRPKFFYVPFFESYVSKVLTLA